MMAKEVFQVKPLVIQNDETGLILEKNYQSDYSDSKESD
jgi:hypothetical protein